MLAYVAAELIAILPVAHPGVIRASSEFSQVVLHDDRSIRHTPRCAPAFRGPSFA